VRRINAYITGRHRKATSEVEYKRRIYNKKLRELSPPPLSV